MRNWPSKVLVYLKISGLQHACHSPRFTAALWIIYNYLVPKIAIIYIVIIYIYHVNMISSYFLKMLFINCWKDGSSYEPKLIRAVDLNLTVN